MLPSGQNLRPLFDRVVIEPIREEETSSGGIVIPDAAKEKQNKATVLAVGDEVSVVKPGDVVLFMKYAGADVNFGDQKLKIMSERDILTVLE